MWNYYNYFCLFKLSYYIFHNNNNKQHYDLLFYWHHYEVKVFKIIMFNNLAVINIIVKDYYLKCILKYYIINDWIYAFLLK